MNDIELSNHCINNIKPINIGFDECSKYYFERGESKYILKVFPKKNYTKKAREYSILKKMQDVDIITPCPITFGKFDEDNFFYILSWIEGDTLTQYSKDKTDIEMYNIGLKIGSIMKKIHAVDFDKANIDLDNKIQKIYNKLNMFRMLKLDYATTVSDFLENNIEKLKQQPISIVHGDLNEDNIIISKTGKIGIIDFGNSDIDYSYQDLHQIQMYNRFLSIPLSVGILNEYLENVENKELFWSSFKIYSAYYCLSKILWAQKYNDDLLMKEMLQRSKQTVEDFGGFKLEKPTWYSRYIEKNEYGIDNV